MGAVYRGFDQTLDRQAPSRFDAAGGLWGLRRNNLADDVQADLDR